MPRSNLRRPTPTEAKALVRDGIAVPRRGRPPLPEGEALTHTVAFRLCDRDALELEQAADEGETIHDVARWLVLLAIERGL